VGLEVYAMPAAAVPTAPGELDQLMRLWQREAALGDIVLLVDADDADRSDALRESGIARLVETATAGPLFLSSRERRGPWQRPVLTFDVDKPTSTEQRAIWQALIDHTGLPANGQVERLANQFDLATPTILAAYDGALGRLASQAPAPGQLADAFGSALWDLCRSQARPQLDDLAQRIEAAATWDDLILPERQVEMLHEIAIHLRQRSRVYEQWGFASKGKRGQGITALFAGPSGTGKTMAAEVLARELQLDLYRIDLSAVVSKYIGETEKNLRRVFDAAETGGAILLFDEADALFGRRSEVKDSHDRHANIEVSYLLQRMEAYRGLAILTTNQKDALDEAFLRRLRFAIEFPFPSVAERARIWRTVFPAATPTRGLDVAKLARLNLAGGNIRNIALNAAFLAAEAGEPVQMQHLLATARREFAKLEQPLSAAETRDWVEPESED
jgi:predicted nucleic acid-binding protein